MFISPGNAEQTLQISLKIPMPVVARWIGKLVLLNNYFIVALL